MNIYDYGWNEYYEEQYREKASIDMYPGRIIADYGQKVRIFTNDGEICVNRPIKDYKNNMHMAVGDWVALENDSENQLPCIRFVLTRRTKFSRVAAGIEQVCSPYSVVLRSVRSITQ